MMKMKKMKKKKMKKILLFLRSALGACDAAEDGD